MTHIPEVYGSIFKFLTQAKLIKIVKQKGKYANIALLYYPWNLGQEELCDSFSELDVNVLMKNQNLDREGLFLCSVRKDLVNKVKILLKDPDINPGSSSNHAIGEALYNNNYEMVQLLLKDPRVDPRDKDNQLIRDATRFGLSEIAQLLLEWRGPNEKHKIDPSDMDNEALMNALRRGDDKIVRLLLKDPRVDPRALHNRALKYAFSSSLGSGDVVKTLLLWRGPNGEKIDPSVRGNQAILDASTSGNDEIVRLLLEDERVDPRILYGMVEGEALLQASKKGHPLVVKTLLAWRGPNGERIDPSANNNQYIKFAFLNDHDEVVKLLANSPEIQFQKDSNVLRQIYNAYNP